MGAPGPREARPGDGNLLLHPRLRGDNQGSSALLPVPPARAQRLASTGGEAAWPESIMLLHVGLTHSTRALQAQRTQTPRSG